SELVIIQDRCISRRSYTIFDMENPVEILDETKVLHLKAFKFPSGSTVFLTCTVRLCNEKDTSACDLKTDCDGEITQGLRKRSVSDDEILYIKKWIVNVDGSSSNGKGSHIV
ncbi:unnamed protein product, partial [Owenia fusiformis]